MKSYIWSIPTRGFHWIFVLGIIFAFATGEQEENMINWHAGLGLMVGVLLIFRLLWGIFGPKYSKFKDFPVGIRSIITFLKNPQKSLEDHPGHNPLAALVTIFILLSVSAVVVTGMMLLSSRGNFIPELSNPPMAHTYKDIHETCVAIMFIFIGIHLVGVITDFILHKTSKTYSTLSIFSGFKNVQAESVKLNFFQSLLFAIMMLVAFYTFSYGIMKNDYNYKDDKQEKMEDKD